MWALIRKLALTGLDAAQGKGGVALSFSKGIYSSSICSQWGKMSDKSHWLAPKADKDAFQFP